MTQFIVTFEDTALCADRALGRAELSPDDAHELGRKLRAEAMLPQDVVGIVRGHIERGLGQPARGEAMYHICVLLQIEADAPPADISPAKIRLLNRIADHMVAMSGIANVKRDVDRQHDWTVIDSEIPTGPHPGAFRHGPRGP